MPEAMVNGVRIWYQETGAGDPVVQIHGAGFGHFNFATATPILSKSFRCIDFDMRGYGQSERPFQRYDMEVWADDVAGLIDHLGLRSAHIHGTSMGGMVAQQFAAKYPERTQRLVIIARRRSSTTPASLPSAAGSTSPSGLAWGHAHWQS
jgi:3-oxoadipate enol-lactonase